MDDLWWILYLHLSDKRENKSKHVNPEQPGEIPFSVREMCINDSLECNMILDIIAERIIYIWNDLLDGLWLIARHLQPIIFSNVSQLLKEIYRMEIYDVVINWNG